MHVIHCLNLNQQLQVSGLFFIQIPEIPQAIIIVPYGVPLVSKLTFSVFCLRRPGLIIVTMYFEYGHRIYKYGHSIYKYGHGIYKLL